MPEEDLIEKVKKLSPQDRIQELKKLQEKNKKEIEKAQNLIKESEDEAEKEEEIKSIPVPQIKSVDIGSLFGREEKEIFKAKRFAEDKKTEEPEEKKENVWEKLEEIAASAPQNREREAAANTDHLAQLSKVPARTLMDKAAGIYSAVKESGYMNNDQQEELNHIHYAAQKKLEDIESGRYANFSKDVAHELVVTERMKNWLQESYGR